MPDQWVHALTPAAMCAVRDHLRLQAGEELLVVWDETVSDALYSAIRSAGRALGARVTAVTYEPVAYHPINEYGVFAGRSLKDEIRLPPPVATALRSADAFILLCSDTELLFGPDIPETLRGGARGLFMPYLDAFNAHRMLFRSSQEVADQAALINAVADTLDGERHVRVTSEEGTDLEVRLGTYRMLRRTGVVGRGQMLFLPAGNVARVPDEGSANGVLVIDRTVCANDYKELREPIRIEVVAGNAVSITGGMEAKLLREFLKDQGDHRAYHLTELAVGTNPLCRLSGVGAPSEDTHVHGTVSFALGCDVHLGGTTPGPAHVDMTMRFPTLISDGTVVTDQGRLAVTASAGE